MCPFPRIGISANLRAVYLESFFVFGKIFAGFRRSSGDENVYLENETKLLSEWLISDDEDFINDTFS